MITAREIGPQRYRTSYGRYYEDFQVGALVSGKFHD